MKHHENQWTSMKDIENPWTSMKINANDLTSKKINEQSWKSLEILGTYGTAWSSNMKIVKNRWQDHGNYGIHDNVMKKMTIMFFV